MALFRTDYSGRGELSERQQKVRGLFTPEVHVSNQPIACPGKQLVCACNLY